MRNGGTYQRGRSTWVQFVLILAGALLMTSGYAQDEDAVPEQIRSRMSLTVVQYPQDTVELNALLRARIGASFQRIEQAAIEFLTMDAEGTEVLLGEGITGARGVATLKVPVSSLVTDADGYRSAIARYEGDETMTASEGDILFRRAKLMMEPMEDEDEGVYTISVRAVQEIMEGEEEALEGVPVSLYVRRMFSLLKVGEGTTDTSGIVALEFPSDLPGDPEGNIEILARAEETDDYGDLAVTLNQAWGRPVSTEFTPLPKALWSPYPPTWMVITFFVLMGLVWVHYGVIVYQLIRIKKEKPTASA